MEIFLRFLVQVRMGLDLMGGEISSKLAMAFLFRSCDSSFFKTMCTITAKQHNCRFSVLKRIIQNVAAGFAFLTVVEPRRSFG